MTATRDFGCEIMSFIVLLVLSALSHFWYIMIVICAGTVVWGISAVVAHIFLNRSTIPAAEFGDRSGYGISEENTGVLHGVLGSGELPSSPCAPNLYQE